MLEELKEEQIVNKVGRAVQALDADPEADDRAEPGARPLVDPRGSTR